MEVQMMPMNIEIVDSRDDNSLAYIIINNCRVPVKKVKIKDFCYVLKVIGNTCHVSIDMEDCDQEPIK